MRRQLFAAINRYLDALGALRRHHQILYNNARKYSALSTSDAGWWGSVVTCCRVLEVRSRLANSRDVWARFTKRVGQRIWLRHHNTRTVDLHNCPSPHPLCISTLYCSFGARIALAASLPLILNVMAPITLQKRKRTSNASITTWNNEAVPFTSEKTIASNALRERYPLNETQSQGKAATRRRVTTRVERKSTYCHEFDHSQPKNL